MKLKLTDSLTLPVAITNIFNIVIILLLVPFVDLVFYPAYGYLPSSHFINIFALDTSTKHTVSI